MIHLGVVVLRWEPIDAPTDKIEDELPTRIGSPSTEAPPPDSSPALWRGFARFQNQLVFEFRKCRPLRATTTT